MRTIFIFTRRSILLFLRDKSTVFFSFLSTLVLVALYFLFIGKTYADGMAEMVGNFLSTDAVYSLVYVQMIVGVLVLNSLSLSIGAFSTIAHDFENKRIDSFLLTPINPSSLLISYFSGGFIISFSLNTFTWLLSILVIGIAFGYWASVSAVLAVSGVLLFASMVSCSLMLLFTALVKSSAAIGVFSGIAGTFFGFLCGIYMPYEMLGKGVEAVGSALPLTHITIWLKQIVLQDAFANLSVSNAFQAPMLESFSAQSVGFLGMNASLGIMLLYTAIFALICLFVSERLVRRRLDTYSRPTPKPTQSKV